MDRRSLHLSPSVRFHLDDRLWEENDPPEIPKKIRRELARALTLSELRDFAGLLTPRAENTERLSRWINQVRAADLPHLHAFTRGLHRDHHAVNAALTLPYSNGLTEGVNTKTKRIARQIHGRAGFTLLRHRILLG
ncbi:transposase [Streptomyces sp. NPDC005195]|uniref:transposase n=1 Tax=Streptomyces sp. NPDC005195 TaxID=3154561 RepID=UPI0033BAFA96